MTKLYLLVETSESKFQGWVDLPSEWADATEPERIELAKDEIEFFIDDLVGDNTEDQLVFRNKEYKVVANEGDTR